MFYSISMIKMVGNKKFKLPYSINGRELTEIIKETAEEKLIKYKVKIIDVPEDLNLGHEEKEIIIKERNILKRLGHIGITPELGHREMDIIISPDKEYEELSIEAPFYVMDGDRCIGNESFDECDADILIKGIREKMKRKYPTK